MTNKDEKHYRNWENKKSLSGAEKDLIEKEYC
jgi:hypothetical protein